MNPADLDPPAEHAAPAAAVSGSDAGWAVAPRRLVVAVVGATLLALVWIVAVALSAGHGFDTSDEGFYLLSYRWWHTSLRTFTGVQFIYGPIFQLLGYNIAGLRLVRLVTVVGTLVIFGWAFMSWLRGRRPAAPVTPLWELNGMAAIVASGGLVYGWLPLSAGYNDVSMLGALLAAAIVLRVATHVERGTRIRAWLALAMGPLAVGMLLAKWASSGLTLAVAAAVGLVVVAPRGWRETLRLVGWSAAGAAATVLLIQVLIVPLTHVVPEMIAVNKLAATSSNSPYGLLKVYYGTSVELVSTVLRSHALLLLAAVAAVGLRGRRGRWVAGLLAVAGGGLSTYRIIASGDLHGGTRYLPRYPVAAVAMFLVAVAVGVAVLLDRRPPVAGSSSLRQTGLRGWVVLGMVAVLPLTQGAGTGNALYFMAINCFAAWIALMIAVATGIEAAPALARRVSAAAIVGALVVSVSAGTDGVWSHPYRTQPYRATTAVAAGVPALASVRLDPLTAQRYSQLYTVLRPYVEPPGRAIMAFDEMAGIVLLLNGRSVGEAWYSRLDTKRTAAGIRAECASGHPWWGDRPPIVIFDRKVTPLKTAALQACGLDLRSGYRLLPTDQSLNLQIYVPSPATKDNP